VVALPAAGWRRSPNGTDGPVLASAPDEPGPVERCPFFGSRASPVGVPSGQPRRQPVARQVGVEGPPHVWLPSGPCRCCPRVARAPSVLRAEEAATTAGSAHPFGPRSPTFGQSSRAGSGGSFLRGRFPASGRGPALARRLPPAATARQPDLFGRGEWWAWVPHGAPATPADPPLSLARADARGPLVLPVAGLDDLAGVPVRSLGPWIAAPALAFPSSPAWPLSVRPVPPFSLLPPHRARGGPGAHRPRSAAGDWLEPRPLAWHSEHQGSCAFDRSRALDPLVVPWHRPQALVGASLAVLPVLPPPSRPRGHRASAAAAWPRMVPVK
jgi:hypothetical protein